MSMQCDFCHKIGKGFKRCGYKSEILKGVVKVYLCDECISAESNKITVYGKEKDK